MLLYQPPWKMLSPPHAFTGKHAFHYCSRRLVYYNLPLQLGHCALWQENAQTSHFGCQPEEFDHSLCRNRSQKTPDDNQNDSFMHLLSMNCNHGQVTTFGSKCTSFLLVFVQYGPTRTLFPRIYQEQHGENGVRSNANEQKETRKQYPFTPCYVTFVAKGR